jgi:hypothetical protein
MSSVTLSLLSYISETTKDHDKDLESTESGNDGGLLATIGCLRQILTSKKLRIVA